MTHSDSPEQLALYTAIAETSDSIMVSAVAGSGKTTSIIGALRHLPNAEALSVSFLAFNKSIVTTLSERVPPWCNVCTFHSLGYAAWRRFAGKVKVDGDKVRGILKDLLRGGDFYTYGQPASKLVSWAKSAGLGTTLASTEPSEWYHLMSHQNFVFDGDEDKLVAVARGALERANTMHDVVDFDDMLYLPLLRNVHFDKQNVVFVDEAQDTNGVQRALLKKMIAAKPYGRLIAVGDENQAIYGFRGADATAMDTLREEFNMITMPLSVSWRCSKAVVAEAQRVMTGRN